MYAFAGNSHTVTMTVEDGFDMGEIEDWTIWIGVTPLTTHIEDIIPDDLTGQVLTFTIDSDITAELINQNYPLYIAQDDEVFISPLVFYSEDASQAPIATNFTVSVTGLAVTVQALRGVPGETGPEGPEGPEGPQGPAVTIDQDAVYYTGGNITLNSATVANLTATQMTLSGVQTGDIVYYEISSTVTSTASSAKAFQVYTYVSGTRTNPFGVALGDGLTTSGHLGWFIESETRPYQLSGLARYALQSGDISGGAVTVGLAYVGNNTNARTMNADANNPLEAYAWVIRP